MRTQCIINWERNIYSGFRTLSPTMITNKIPIKVNFNFIWWTIKYKYMNLFPFVRAKIICMLVMWFSLLLWRLIRTHKSNLHYTHAYLYIQPTCIQKNCTGYFYESYKTFFVKYVTCVKGNIFHFLFQLLWCLQQIKISKALWNIKACEG